MKLKLLAFGFAADILGQRKLEIDLPESATTADLRIQLDGMYPGLKKIGTYVFAVNQTYAQGIQSLNELDEVAIIPPVSGG